MIWNYKKSIFECHVLTFQTWPACALKMKRLKSCFFGGYDCICFKCIIKWYLQKKKFEIRAAGSPEGRKFSYYTDCDTKSKYLLQLCKATHMFQLAIHPKLIEIRHLEEQGIYTIITISCMEMTAFIYLTWHELKSCL